MSIEIDPITQKAVNPEAIFAGQTVRMLTCMVGALLFTLVIFGA